MKKYGLILTLIGTFLLPSLIRDSIHSRDFHGHFHARLSIAMVLLIAGAVLLVYSWERPVKNDSLNPKFLAWICVFVSFILSVGRSIDPELWGCSWDLPPEVFGVFGVLGIAFAYRKKKEPYDIIKEAFAQATNTENR